MQTADLSSNYFELFGLPVSFDINLDDLSKRYRELQRAVHPDRYAKASEAERRLSVQLAARINEGMRTLKDPLARGKYLLEIQGVDLEENSTALDHEFLMEQMELREHLDAIKGSDSAFEKLNSISKDIANRNQELTSRLRDCFQSGDSTDTTLAKDLIRKLQFFRKLEEEVNELDEELAEI